MSSYGGYNQVCNIGDEIKDPTRTIPRSIVLSTFLAAGLYMLMTIVILGMIPWQDVKESRTVASVFIARTLPIPRTVTDVLAYWLFQSSTGDKTRSHGA